MPASRSRYGERKELARQHDVVDREVVPDHQPAADQLAHGGGLVDGQMAEDAAAGPQDRDVGRNRGVGFVRLGRRDGEGPIERCVAGADLLGGAGVVVRDEAQTAARLARAQEAARGGDQIDLHPRVGGAAVGRDVVEEQAEIAHADVEQRAELGVQGGGVGAIGCEAGSGREGEDEAHPGGVAGGRQRREVVQELRRVRLAPAAAVERVALRRVDVGVEAGARQEAQQVEALLEGVRRAVEALDDAVHRHLPVAVVGAG